MNNTTLSKTTPVSLVEIAESASAINLREAPTFKNDIRYLVLSDVHFGHKKTPTKFIVANLTHFLKAYEHKEDLDVIFFAGDVFDASLELKSDDIGEVMWFLGWLFDYCARYDIALRVLEGTPSHDWAQSKIFSHVATLTKSPVNYRYINALSIEHMESLGINVLYMPDEWNLSTDKTYDEVLQLLRDNHLDKVDIGIFHGMFAYQAPPMAVKLPLHDEAKYLSVVRYFINIGHVHTASVFDRILAQGSFDRLCHGDESAKGAFEVVLSKAGEHRYCFIENTRAMLYKTIPLRDSDVAAAIKHIEKVTSSFPKGSHIRLKASKNHAAIVAFDELRKRFIDFNLSKLTLEEEKEQSERQQSDSLIDQAKPYQAITITPDNLEALLTTEIKADHNLTESQWAFFRNCIAQITV